MPRSSFGATLLLAFLFAFSGVQAQDYYKEKKADKKYLGYAYITAAKLYEEVLKDGKGSPDVFRKLGNCYRYLGETEKAEEVYVKAIEVDGSDPMTMYYYSEMLRSNGKYKESQKWIEKYAKIKTEDSRAKKYLEDPDFYKTIKSDPSKFKITHLSINTPEAEFSPTYYKEQIAFISNRIIRGSIQRTYGWDKKPFLDLYLADVQKDKQLTNPYRLDKGINSKFHEGPPSFTPDAMTMYFTRNGFSEGKKSNGEDGINYLSIYMRTFDAGSWVDEQAFPFNSPEYSTGHPTITKDGQQLYFVSDMPGGKGGTDLYMTRKMEDGTWGKPIRLDTLNTEGDEMFPYIHESGLLFFASDGHPGLGGLDVFMAKVVDDTTYGDVNNVGYPLNDTRDDFGMILDKEMKFGYFASNREGGKGDDDLYMFELTKPLITVYYAVGTVTDRRTGEILPESIVTLIDIEGDTIAEVKTDENGQYKIEVDPAEEYTMKVNHDEYFEETITINTDELDPNKTEVTTDVSLVKDVQFSVYGVVTDSITGQPLDSVHVLMVDLLTNMVLIDTITTTNGDIRKKLENKKLDDQFSVSIFLRKKGYHEKIVRFATVLEKEGEVRVDNYLRMRKFTADDIIKVDPIYFDVNKWNIRPDAAEVLDKIVKVMKDNPTMEIELGSHTDCRGSDAGNMTLSQNRANSSAEYIRSQGIEHHRIYGKGYGETKPVSGCEKCGTCTEEQYQDDRRTEFVIVKI